MMLRGGGGGVRAVTLIKHRLETIRVLVWLSPTFAMTLGGEGEGGGPEIFF